MKKIIVVSAAITGLIGAFVVPGMALARESCEVELGHGLIIGDERIDQIEMRGGATGTIQSERGRENMEQEDESDDANEEENEHGTSTRNREDGEKNDKSSKNATSSEHREDDENDEDEDRGRGFGKGGLVGFFRWMFGLPDDTTVGEIRAEMMASSTDSSPSTDSEQEEDDTTESKSRGFGFFGRLFGFFGFGDSN